MEYFQSIYTKFSLQKLTRDTTTPDDSPKYAANMITVNTDNQIKNSYAADIKNVFNGNPYHEKFSENPEKTRRNINAWVSKRTNKKIKELLPPGIRYYITECRSLDNLLSSMNYIDTVEF